jgi:hypothetical protein
MCWKNADNTEAINITLAFFFFGKKLASINAALTLNGDPPWLVPRKWLLGISFNLNEFDWWLAL